VPDPLLSYLRLGRSLKPLRDDAGWGKGGPMEHERFDIGMIREWAEKGGNLAVRTGRQSGAFVLDVDPRNGGDVSLAALVAEHGDLPETYVVNSGGGGLHFYFRLPDFEVHSGTEVLGDGLDIKGERSYVVAPGSIKATGERYTLGREPDAPVLPAPDWLVEVLRARAGATTERAGERASRPLQEVEKVSAPAPCCEAVAEAAVASIAAKMDALRAQPEGKRLKVNRQPVGWDDGFWRLAARLFEIARWPYASDSLAEVERVFTEHAPEAEGTFDPDHAWTQGEAHAGSWLFGNTHRIEEHVTVLRDADRVPIKSRTLARTRAEMVEVEVAVKVVKVERPIEERFPLLGVELLDPNRPPRAWLLEGVVPEGDQVSIVAPGGTGKSLLALALSIAAVSGRGEFLSRAVSLGEGRKVMYLDKENSEDDWRERLLSFGLTMESVAPFWGSTFLPLSFPAIGGLDTKAGASAFFELLDHYGIGQGDVVVLDSTQRVTDGEENSNDTIRAFYTLTAEELKRRGVTVIRTDNTGKDTSLGARGASAKSDDVGYSWLLERRDSSDVFTLKNTKFRGLGSGSEVKFRVVVSDGRTEFLALVEDATTLVRSTNERFQIAATAVLHDRYDAAEASPGVEPWLTRNTLREEVKQRRIDGEPISVNNSDLPGLLTNLVEGGYVKAEQGPNRSIRYTWVRDYLGVIAERGVRREKGEDR
jgi:hypothetical protein